VAAVAITRSTMPRGGDSGAYGDSPPCPWLPGDMPDTFIEPSIPDE